MVIQRRRSSFGAAGAMVPPPPTTLSAAAIAPLEDTNQISSSDDDESWNRSSSQGQDQFQQPQDPNRCPETVLNSLNERLARSQRSEKGVAGSLELLRLNLQASFDKEIDVIVNRYKEKFFLKAFRNLKTNLGETFVSDKDLSSVLQKMVQQSAVQYKSSTTSDSMFSSTNPGSLFSLSDSDGSLDDIPTSLPMFNATFQKYSPFPVWKHSSTVSEQTAAAAAQKRKRSLQTTDHHHDGQVQAAANKKHSWSSSSFDNILHSTLTRPPNATMMSSSSSASPFQFRPKATWNSTVSAATVVTKDTQFVLDSHANKLFSVNDRVTMKHPELIRYTPDSAEDMDWLINERVISPAQRHMSIQLLIREEVIKLKRETVPNWAAEGDLVGFTVPEFMIKKMQKFVAELNARKEKARSGAGYFETVMRSSVKDDPTVNIRSNLSTSHATLSALLGTCSDSQDN